MEQLSYKVGDNLPAFSVQLVDAEGELIPLDGATVQLRVLTPTRVLEFERDLEIEDADESVVGCTWAEGELAATGLRLLAVVVTYGTGERLTVPSEGYIVLRVEA